MGKSIQIFAVFVCLAVSVYSEALQNCKGNEETWCQSVLTAKRCGVFKYCQTAVWNGQKPKITSCHGGGYFVKKAQLKTMHLYNNAAKLDTIAGLCSDLDDQTRQLCKSLVVEAGPEVLTLINSTVVPPVFIGSILGLCPPELQPEPQPQPQSTIAVNHGLKEPKICTDCKVFLKDIEFSFIGPDIQKKMKKRMEIVCEEVPPSFYKMCQNLSDDWIKHVFEYMNEEMQLEKVCNLFLPCNASEKGRWPFSGLYKKVTEFPNPLSDVTCKTCKEVMDELRDFLKSPEFQAEAEEFIAGTVCNVMPHHMIRECKHRIMRYGNLIFDMIIAGFDSQVTCEAVRMCPATEEGWKSYSLKNTFKNFFKRAVSNFLPDMNMLPIFEIFGDSLGGTECSLCKLLIREVEKVIADDQSELQITSVMFEACNLLPEPWSSECVDFVKMNGKKIIEDILHNLPPGEICFSFGLCEDDRRRHRRDTTIYVISEDKGAKIPSPKINPENNKENSGSVTHGSAWCQICGQIAGIVNRILGSQQLNLGVDTIYQQVCAVLPKSISYRCSRISKHMIDGVLGGMSSVAQPQLICGAIGVCDFHLTPMNYSVPLPDELKPPYH